MVGNAVAQTITYEKDGRRHAYSFKPAEGANGLSDALVPNRRATLTKRLAPRELPRGPKNIPWDEPGKFSGNPVVVQRSRPKAVKRPAPTALQRHPGAAAPDAPPPASQVTQEDEPKVPLLSAQTAAAAEPIVHAGDGQRRVLEDPEHTGAVTAPKETPPRSGASGLSNTLCTMLLFGVGPGC